jgi:AraC-like DNA-binding protein
VLATEVLLTGGGPPADALEILKGASALALAGLFAVWTLTPRLELLAIEPIGTGTPPQVSTAARIPTEDERYRERLVALMREEKAYRHEGLTISTLARQLDIPEYRLRRIINQHLGYRNFNTFVNDLRIEEACRILSDPTHERLPILNLALDLGYGSSGPFNRAFRAKTGQTPTEYRRAHLGSTSPAA